MGAQEETKRVTKSPTSRGRRRLDFKRFQGKTMFLDLPGYRHVARLEEDLTARGASLETTFHAGVKYLITMTRSGDSSQSPSTPSPNTPGTAKSSISQLLSPATDHSPSEVTPRQGILTRSQQMLQLSRGRGGRRGDLRVLAQRWGCKIVSLEELLAELKKLKPLPPVSGHADKKETCGTIRRLRGPFLKVEDMSRAYRPLVLEMRRWPHPLCHTSHKASPFDPPHPTRPPHEDTKHIPAADGVHGADGEGGGKGRGEGREKRPGHCECCALKFEDLHQHLCSARHREYASNEENFKSLDRLIAQGKSFNQFIYELRSTPPNSTCTDVTPPTYTPPQSTSPAASSQPDSVVLVTLPTSHATPTRRRSPRKHQTTPSQQHHTPKKHSPHKSPDSTPVNRKRKAKSAEATPTSRKSPTFEATPTKKLRFSASPDLIIPRKRPRSHTHSPTDSPVSKRVRPAVSPCPEGVRRSPRLLLKQMMSSSPANDSSHHRV